MKHHQIHAKREVQGKVGFNQKLAVWISKYVMTMSFFYFCCALTAIPLIIPSIISQILFISNGIQLTMLPLLGVSAAVGAISSVAIMNSQFMHSVRSELMMTALMKHIGMTDQDIEIVHRLADAELRREAPKQ